MITKEELFELSKVRSKNLPVLSVYLDTSPQQTEGKVYRLVLKELLKGLEGNLSSREKRTLSEEASKSLSFIETEFKPEGKGFVFFSSKSGLWKAFHLPVPVRNTARFQASPYVKPLLTILGAHERQCVVLVDKGRARLFLIQMGEIEEYNESTKIIPTKHKQGGRSQANFQRRHDAYVDWHLKDVIEQLIGYSEKGSFDRLILAGPEEALSSFQRLLPKTLQEKVGGVFSASLNASASSILKDATELLKQVDNTSKQSLVNSAINLAKQGGPAVLGVEKTLAALHEGRVHSLLVAEDFTTSGYVCDNCSFLSITARDLCPQCGDNLLEVEDIIDRAVSLTWEKEGRVETIREEAAQSLIRATGDGIAGMAWF